MNKPQTIILILLIITAQIAFLSCFHSDSKNTFANGPAIIVISKAEYIYLRVHITIRTSASFVLDFSDGAQREIIGPSDFEVVLTQTGRSRSFNVSRPNIGIELSYTHPVNIAVISEVPDNFTDKFAMVKYDQIDFYWIKISNSTGLEIKSYGLGF